MGQEQLSFVSHGRTLQGTLTSPDSPGPSPCIVLCHGFGSYADDLGGFVRLADFLAKEGMASFRFSFAGSSPYQDKGTIRPATDWVNDALSALACALQNPKVDDSRCGLLGVSVGGGVAVQAAAMSRWARAVVALAPVADGEDWLRRRWQAGRGQPAWESFVGEVDADHKARILGEPGRSVSSFDVQGATDREGWESLLQRFPQILSEMSLESVWDTMHFKPLFYARNLSRPLCLIHSNTDESVPPDHSRLILRECVGPKVLKPLDGAPHCPWDTSYEPRFQAIALEWFRQWLA